MKNTFSIRTLIVIFFVAISGGVALCQVPVEKSKEKVIISGVQYYIHTIKKGETAYSISRAYGISVEDLTRENPPALYGIKIGQALRIPVNPSSNNTALPAASSEKKRDESRFIYHHLRPGETVYSLSHLYGVSENDITRNNEGLDINKLSVGAEIAVPRREFMNDRQKFDEQEKKYFYHKVAEGESLSSIAKMYGLTVRELRRENRDVRFPQVGYYIKVPGEDPNKPAVVATEPAKEDVSEAEAEVPAVRKARPGGFTNVGNLSGSFNVAVLLPFYLDENNDRVEIDSSAFVKGRRSISVKDRDEDWIYPRSIDFVEMYQGILLAADTLRSMGLDVNIYTYDIKSDTVSLTRLIKSGALSAMDLIIGPVYSHNLGIVAAYAKNLRIPVVSPVPLINNKVLSGNPTLFMVNSSLEVAQKTLAKKISEYYDCNLVYVNADTLGIDNDVKRFKKQIFNELSYHMSYDDIKFKELLFYSRAMLVNDSIDRLSHALSDKVKNVVIISSEDPPVISETVVDVHSLSRKYNVKVFGYPAMREVENLDPKYYFDLEVLMYSPYWIDYTRKNVKHFNNEYRHKFLSEPSEKSFAWEGFDITYYFLSGLAMHGSEFIRNPEIHNPELLESGYDFDRLEKGDGFENQKLFLIKYTKDYELKLIEEN
jgi:LysM repeat protein